MNYCGNDRLPGNRAAGHQCDHGAGHALPPWLHKTNLGPGAAASEFRFPGKRGVLFRLRGIATSAISKAQQAQ
jgi:hypothetical protein